MSVLLRCESIHNDFWLPSHANYEAIRQATALGECFPPPASLLLPARVCKHPEQQQKSFIGWEDSAYAVGVHDTCDRRGCRPRTAGDI